MREANRRNRSFEHPGARKGCTELYTTGWSKGNAPQRWSVKEPLDLEASRKRRLISSFVRSEAPFGEYQASFRACDGLRETRR